MDRERGTMTEADKKMLVGQTKRKERQEQRKMDRVTQKGTGTDSDSRSETGVERQGEEYKDRDRNRTEERR